MNKLYKILPVNGNVERLKGEKNLPTQQSINRSRVSFEQIISSGIISLINFCTVAEKSEFQVD